MKSSRRGMIRAVLRVPLFYKILIAMKARCPIVISPHPSAVRCITRSAELMNEAARRAGTVHVVGGYDEIFAAESFAAANIQAIADRAGISKPLIYNYFGSKEDLFTSVLDSCENGADLMAGDRATFGRRVAHDLGATVDRTGRIVVDSDLSGGVGGCIASHRGRSGEGRLGECPDRGRVGGEDRHIHAACCRRDSERMRRTLAEPSDHPLLPRVCPGTSSR